MKTPSTFFKPGELHCESCEWYESTQYEDITLRFGQCRRHAPTTSGFAQVSNKDWCGDHSLQAEWFISDASKKQAEKTIRELRAEGMIP